MAYLTLIISIVFLIMILQNRSRSRQIGEDIDEIRNSLYEIRSSSKSMRADWNLKIARLNTDLLKLQGKIPLDRIPLHITKDCIGCGTCTPECPVNAINEGVIFEIDPALCIACNKCSKVCPVNACQSL
jgi:ferredoxin